jgi:hypothetical protein
MLSIPHCTPSSFTVPPPAQFTFTLTSAFSVRAFRAAITSSSVRGLSANFALSHQRGIIRVYVGLTVRGLPYSPHRPKSASSRER